MKTEDLMRVKNDLALAVQKTFERQGIDLPAGLLILQAMMYDLQRPALENLISERSERVVDLQSDTEPIRSNDNQ